MSDGRIVGNTNIEWGKESMLIDMNIYLFQRPWKMMYVAMINIFSVPGCIKAISFGKPMFKCSTLGKISIVGRDAASIKRQRIARFSDTSILDGTVSSSPYFYVCRIVRQAIPSFRYVEGSPVVYIKREKNTPGFPL